MVLKNNKVMKTVFCLVLAVMMILPLCPEHAYAAKKKPAKPYIDASLSNNTIKIKWKIGKNTKKYQVYRKIKNGKYKKVKTISVKKKRFFTYKMTGKADTKYSFKVRGLNGKKKGKFSNVRTVVIPLKLTVTSADSFNISKLHSVLVNGKGLTLKIKGSKAAADKTIKTLQNKIQAYNKQDVLFKYKYENKSGSYCMYSITSDNALRYKYTIMFVKKLFTMFQNDGNLASINFHDPYNTSTADELTNLTFYHEVYKQYKASGSTDSFVDYLAANSNTFYEYDVDPDLARSYGIAFDAKSFGELSDAMKVWVISESGYFGCSMKEFESKMPRYNLNFRDKYKFNVTSETFEYVGREKRVFAMEYSMDKKYNDPRYEAKYNYRGVKALKHMYGNTAIGVCDDFAECELLLFKQLGISAWYNFGPYNLGEAYEKEFGKVSSQLHAWTVIKAKNAKGKVLWMPFDYNIGPTLYKFDSVEQSYRYYLLCARNQLKNTGIPDHKTFTNSDFS